MPTIDDKEQARRQWNTTPCGTGDYLAGLEPDSREYFDAIRRYRYAENPWMERLIDWQAGKDRRLLEVGFGIGTDLLRFAENGAEVSGIDLCEEHHRLARRNFEVHGFPCELQLGDAAAMDCPNGSFDVVYSLGVLHHTPDTERCIAEIHRVLRPGGRLILALYHRYSAFHLYGKLLNDGLLRGKLFTLGYRGLMATIERGADGKEICPLVKTYSRCGMRRLVRGFSEVDLRVGHFDRFHLQLPRVGPWIPESWEPRLEPYLGHYVIADARK